MGKVLRTDFADHSPTQLMKRAGLGVPRSVSPSTGAHPCRAKLEHRICEDQPEKIERSRSKPHTVVEETTCLDILDILAGETGLSARPFSAPHGASRADEPG